MNDSIAPGQQATAGKEIPKGPGNNGSIPFDRKGEVKPSGKGWDAIRGEVVNGGGVNQGKVVNQGS